MSADGDILQHAHGRQQAHVLKGAAHAAPRVLACGQPVGALAQKADLARGHRIDAGDAVEHGALAGAVGADQGHHFTSLDGQVHVVVGNQATECLAGVLHFQQHRADRRKWSARQRLCLGEGALTDLHRHQADQPRPDALAGELQHDDQQDPEEDHLEIAALAKDLR